MVKGRMTHDYHTRLQVILNTLPITKGPTVTINSSVPKSGINTDAVRGNEEVQGCSKSQRIIKASYESPDSGGSGGKREQDNGTPVIMQLGPGGLGGPPNGDDGPGSPGDPDYDNDNNNVTVGNGGGDRRS